MLPNISGRRTPQRPPTERTSGRANVQLPNIKGSRTPQPPPTERRLRRANAHRKLVSIDQDDRNTPAAKVRDLLSHPGLRDNLEATKAQDERGFFARIPHSIYKLASEQVNVLREDTANLATSTALSSAPGIRTAYRGHQLNRSAIKASEYANIAEELGPDSPLGGLARGVQRHAENETRTDLINYTTSAVRDGLELGGVTGLASPIVGLTGAGLKVVHGLAIAGLDQGDQKRKEFRANPRDSRKLAQAVAHSPDLANNANRAIAASARDGVRATIPQPFGQRPLTPLGVRAARVRDLNPRLRRAALNLAEPGKKEFRAQQSYMTTEEQRRVKLPPIGRGK